MFPSLSSCTPSTTVSNSFVSSKNQDLLINLPVTVVGPNTYYVSSGLTGYQITSNAAGLALNNPTLHLVRGTTYRFIVNNPNESMYITNTGGVPYTVGFRYVHPYTNSRFVGTGVGISATTVSNANVLTWSTSVNPNNVALWRQNSGSTIKTYLREGTDYFKVATLVGATYNITYNFPYYLLNCKIDFIAARYTLPTIYHQNNWVIKANSTTLTPSTHYIVDGNYLALTTTYSTNVIISAQEQGGMSGYFLFTPTATTPSTLYYRSRVTPGLNGILNITNSGVVFPANTKIELKENEQVSISLTTPSTYLGYAFYEYYLDKMQNYFAVVNKNYYNPLVKINDRIRKYHNYINYSSNFSLYDMSVGEELYSSPEGLGTGDVIGTIDIENSHVLLDVVNSKVNFYTAAAGLKKTVYLPDFPINWEKYFYTQNGESRCDLLVLAADGILYRIDRNLTLTASQKYTPAVRTTSFLDSNLPINEDIPFKGSFTTYARRNLVASLFPTVIGFAVFQPNIVFLIGSNKIAKINLITGSIFSEMTFPSLDEFLNVAPFDNNGVIVTTVFHRIYYIRDNGSFVDLTPSGGPFVLGQPCSMPFPRSARVAIPDAHNHRLIVLSGKLLSDITYINLGDFVPSYARRFGDIIYVTGHDTNRVVKIETTDQNLYTITENSATKITNFYLSKKVTVVSVLNYSLLAHHYMNNRTTLEFRNTGIKKIIPVTFPYREGPSSSIGSVPRIIRLLGEDTVLPIPGPYMSWWVNGTIKASIKDSEYLGINYRASVPGPHRSAIIIGENAIDYDTRTISSETATDYYAAFSYGTHLVPAVGDGLYFVPPVDVLGVYVLPFYINYFGTSYNSFMLGSNGILAFDTNFPVNSIIPSLTNATTDALVIEPRNLYVDRPINNSNVSAVTWGSLPGGRMPGVYYQIGLLGEFQFYKFKFVGTTALPNPNGFTRFTVPTPQIGTELNMRSTTTIAINDNVSNPITSPGPPYATIVSTGNVVGNPGCTVLAKSTYSASASAYYTTNSNVIYLTSSITPFKKYSNITDATGQSFNFADGSYFTDYEAGNILIGLRPTTNTIVLEGLPPSPKVDLKWIFNIVTTSVTTVRERGNIAPFFSNVISTSTSSTSTDFYTASNIAPSVFSFNATETRTANTYVQISQGIWDTLFVRQKLLSNFYAGFDYIIGKHVVPKTYGLNIRPTVGFEGVGANPPSTFIISVVTTNVEDGTVLTLEILPGNLKPPAGQPATIVGPNSDFAPTFLIRWPTTTRPNVSIAASETISLAVYGNRVDVHLTTLADGITEPLEDFKIRLSGINPGTSDAVTFPESNFNVTAGIIIGRSLNNSPSASAPKSYNNYYIEFGTPYTTSNASSFSTETTLVTFNSAIPSTVQSGTVVTTNLNPDGNILTTYDDQEITTVYTSNIHYRLFTIGTNQPFTTVLSGTVTPITATGDFITLSTAQNLPSNTEMLFKAPDVHPIVEFEVAFFVGRNFQYIEYNYIGQPEHDNTLTVGLRNTAGNRLIQLVGTPVDVYSHLFGSDSGTGLLLNIGPGEFSPIPLNAFIPRFPRIFRERVFDDTEVRYDIYIDFKIATTSDVRASLDFGYLRINDGFYDGTVSIKENDILSVFVPFVNNRTVSAVILSLGNAQFAIPVAPEKDIKNKTEAIYVLPNQNIGQNLQYSFTIPATGTYMVPDYFKNASGLGGAELIFERWSGSPPSLLETLNRGAYYDLFSGDQIIVKNIFTGYRYYDQVEIIFSGVVITRLQVKTIGTPDLVSFLTYDPLVNPFSYQKKQPSLLVHGAPTVFAPGLETMANLVQINSAGIAATFNETFNDIEYTTPLYETRSLKLTLSSGNIGTQVNLFVDGSAVNFIVNGVRTASNSVTVLSGDQLGLEWDVYSYHAANATIWQITNDVFDSSNVYTKVGTWEIRNRAIEDVLLINGVPGSGKSVRQITVSYGGGGYNNDTVAVEISAPAEGEAARGFALVSDSGGVITGIVLTYGGFGYVTPPTVRVTGGNTAPAIATASLVDNLINRESYLAIPFPVKQDSYVLPIVDLPELDTTNFQFTEAKVEQLPIKPNIEFGFFTGKISEKFDDYSYQFLTTQQVQTKFIADSLMSGALGYDFLQTSFTSTPQLNLSTPVQTTLLLNEASCAPILKFTDLFSPLMAVDKVERQGTSTTGFNNWQGVYAATFVTWYNSQQYTGITQTLSNSLKPGMWAPFTLLLDKNNPIFQKLDQQIGRALSGSWMSSGYPTAPGNSPLNLKGGTEGYRRLPNDANIVSINSVNGFHPFKYFFSFKGIESNIKPKIDSITIINSQPITMSWDFINVLESNRPTTELISHTSFTSDIDETFTQGPSQLLGYLYESYDYSSEIFTETLGTATTSIELFYSQLTYDTILINVVEQKLPDFGLLEQGTYNHTSMIYDYNEQADGTIYNLTETFFTPNPQTWDFVSVYYIDNPVKTPQFEGVVQFTYTLEGFELDFDFQINLIHNEEFLIGPRVEIPNYILPEISLVVPGYNLYEFSFVGQYNQETMELPDILPELYFQDKLFVDIAAELYFQDKLFVDFFPELYFQDKLFVDFFPELYFQDKLFLNIDPEIADSGNREIDFDPELIESGIRLFDFLPELLVPTNRYQNLDPVLGDPGNRYLDFSPEEFPSNDRGFDFSNRFIVNNETALELRPELVSQDKSFIPLTLNFVGSTDTLVTMNFVLWQDNEQYNADAFTYGAFATEFTVVADEGRGGDYGQFQGSPPGTPGRPQGPLLSYSEFKGSALLSKSTTYGLGGFTDQAGAALVAARYVAANAFQIVGTNVWNYRIYFGKQVFRPRKSEIYPKIWYIRGS